MIKDDVIYCDCSGCGAHARVPTTVFSAGHDAMRKWVLREYDGRDLFGNYPLGRIQWAVEEAFDETLDFCSSTCKSRRCSHRPNSPRYSESAPVGSVEPGALTRAFNKLARKQFEPEPAETRVINPIGRMK